MNRREFIKSSPAAVAATTLPLAYASASSRCCDPFPIYIYDGIGDWINSGIFAKGIAQQLGAAGDINEIIVYINSVGGVVFEGMAIYNLLKAHPARIVVEIDGMAAGISSLIAMSGDEICMKPNAVMMLSSPLTSFRGDSEVFRKEVAILEKIKTEMVAIYTSRPKLNSDLVDEFMREERLFSAAEAYNVGLIDKII